MSLVENIKQVCRKKHIVVHALEKKAGLAQNSIYKWTRVSPSVDKVKRVADTLGVTVDELLQDT